MENTRTFVRLIKLQAKVFLTVTRVIEIMVVSMAEKILMTVINIKQIETERDVIIRWRHIAQMKVVDIL